MKRKVLFIDIDTQYDFIMPDGCLYVPGAENIIQNLKQLTTYAIKNKIKIFASADSHPKNAEEFSDFPEHCLADSPGNRKLEETTIPAAVIQSYKGPKQSFDPQKSGGMIFTKNALDVFTNRFIKNALAAVSPDVIVLYGVATEFCVNKAAMGLSSAGYKIVVVRDAIRAVDEKAGEKAIKHWKSLGVTFKKTRQILAGNY